MGIEPATVLVHGPMLRSPEPPGQGKRTFWEGIGDYVKGLKVYVNVEEKVRCSVMLRGKCEC